MASVRSVDPSLTITQRVGVIVCAMTERIVSSMNASSLSAGVIRTYERDIVKLGSMPRRRRAEQIGPHGAKARQQLELRKQIRVRGSLVNADPIQPPGGGTVRVHQPPDEKHGVVIVLSEVVRDVRRQIRGRTVRHAEAADPPAGD